MLDEGKTDFAHKVQDEIKELEKRHPEFQLKSEGDNSVHFNSATPSNMVAFSGMSAP